MGNYFAFAGAGELNKAAIGLLDSYLPQDDVDIIVPQTMEASGLIELYNWLNVEFTGIDSSDNIVGHLYDLAKNNHKVALVLLRDNEHPETELMRSAFESGVPLLDLNDSLHPIEWKAPDTMPPRSGGRRKKAEQAQLDAMNAYQEASNEIRELAEAQERQDNMASHAERLRTAEELLREENEQRLKDDVCFEAHELAPEAAAEQEEIGVVNAEIEGPATISLPGIHIHERPDQRAPFPVRPTGLIAGATRLGEGKALGSSLRAAMEEDGTPSPVWDERFPQLEAMQDIESLDRLGQELLGNLMVIIRRMVTQEVGMQMSMTPGVRATTEQFGHTPPVVETTELEDPTPKLPYLFNKETGKYSSRENKKGRPPKGTEVMYLTQQEIDTLTGKGLISNLEVQLELPFD